MLRGLHSQHIYGPAAGYEDLNDHDQLCFDPFFLRVLRSDHKPVLAGKSTLQCLENGALKATRYHRILHQSDRITDVFLEIFLEQTSQQIYPVPYVSSPL